MQFFLVREDAQCSETDLELILTRFTFYFLRYGRFCTHSTIEIGLNLKQIRTV